MVDVTGLSNGIWELPNLYDRSNRAEGIDKRSTAERANQLRNVMFI